MEWNGMDRRTGTERTDLINDRAHRQAARSTEITLAPAAEDQDDSVVSRKLRLIIPASLDHIPQPRMKRSRDGRRGAGRLADEDEDRSDKGRRPVGPRAKADIADEVKYTGFPQARHGQRLRRALWHWTHQQGRGRATEHCPAALRDARPPRPRHAGPHCPPRRPSCGLCAASSSWTTPRKLMPLYLRLRARHRRLQTTCPQRVLPAGSCSGVQRTSDTPCAPAAPEAGPSACSGRPRRRTRAQTNTPPSGREFGQVLKEGVSEDHANKEEDARQPRCASPPPWPIPPAREPCVAGRPHRLHGPEG